MAVKHNPSLKDNEKLILRAANKYRNWMIEELERCVTSSTGKVPYFLNGIKETSDEMKKWIDRFLKGNTRRIQVNPWGPGDHIGILSPITYRYIVEKMIPDLGSDVIWRTEDIISTLQKQSAVTPLSLKNAIEEMRIVSNEWESVKFRNDQLSVLITKVALSDEIETVELGDFWIHLNLTSPLGPGLRIESVHQIRSESKDYYHPHVNGNDELCVGDGDLPMVDALYQGRLEDYFRLVEAILRTYNNDSPYEKLIEWYDPQHEGKAWCEGCEEERDGEEMIYCEECNVSLCDDCSGGGICIECNNYHCNGCSRQCGECGETLCLGCRNSCNKCDTTICPSCTNVCTSCDESYCSDCIKPCVNCSGIVCEACRYMCGCCENEFCKDCIDESCGRCGVDICAGCQTICDECDHLICTDCGENLCEHCGITVCEPCEGEHNCLFAEVADE